MSDDGPVIMGGITAVATVGIAVATHFYFKDTSPFLAMAPMVLFVFYVIHRLFGAAARGIYHAMFVGEEIEGEADRKTCERVVTDTLDRYNSGRKVVVSCTGGEIAVSCTEVQESEEGYSLHGLSCVFKVACNSRGINVRAKETPEGETGMYTLEIRGTAEVADGKKMDAVCIVLIKSLRERTAILSVVKGGRNKQTTFEGSFLAFPNDAWTYRTVTGLLKKE